MLRKIMLLAVMAVSFFAATAGSYAQDPIPECDPCPWGDPSPNLAK